LAPFQIFDLDQRRCSQLATSGPSPTGRTAAIVSRAGIESVVAADRSIFPDVCASDSAGDRDQGGDGGKGWRVLVSDLAADWASLFSPSIFVRPVFGSRTMRASRLASRGVLKRTQRGFRQGRRYFLLGQGWCRLIRIKANVA
jgi:hypothetical protein